VTELVLNPAQAGGLVDASSFDPREPVEVQAELNHFGIAKPVKSKARLRFAGATPSSSTFSGL
jgi:hypothetical protein